MGVIDNLDMCMSRCCREATSQPVYAFGMHKGGSTMLSDFFQIYSKESNISSISISNEVFRMGVADDDYTRDSRIAPLLDKRYLFYGFRYVPLFVLKDKWSYVNRRAIVLVRDPRDCVVSAYYSFLKTHVVASDSDTGAARRISKEREKHKYSSIDDYAISEIDRFIDELNGYIWFAHENSRVFRYEDIIYKKERFFKDSIEFLDLRWDEAAFNKALNTVDVFPEHERIDNHIRSVNPGDHRNKLKMETIDLLTERYCKTLKIYGYI